MVEEDVVSTKLCPTCKQDVPSANAEMHEVHCKRFLIPCPHCDESVNKNYLEEHIEENHAKIKCSDCGENVEKMELESHKENRCRRRNVKCGYCDIILPACDIEDHKEPCGSRTEECETCKRRILIKDLDYHTSIGCQQLDTSAVGKNSAPSMDTNASTLNHSSRFGETGFPVSPQFRKSAYTRQNERFQNINHKYDSDNGFENSFNVEQPVRAGAPVFERQKIQFPFPRSPKDKTSSNSELDRDKNPRKKNAYDATQDKPQKVKQLYQTDTYSKKSLPVNMNVLPEFGIPDQDSDDDDMSIDEKKSPPDLTDDTFLPCEFCNESFPADSLVMHQATCQEMPPTPRPSNLTTSHPLPSNSFFAEEKNASYFERTEQACAGGTSRPTMQPGPFEEFGSFLTKLEQARGITSRPTMQQGAFEENASFFAKLDQARGGPSRPTMQSGAFEENTSFFAERMQETREGTSRKTVQDDDQDTIPCEFCLESFPVDAVAIHQTSCPRNPLYMDSTQSKSTREQRRETSSPPKPETERPKPAATNSLASPLVKSKTHVPRQQLSLAPTFKEPTPEVKPALTPEIKPALTPDVKPAITSSVTGTRAKTKPAISGMENAAKPRGNKGKQGGRPRPKPVSPPPRNFKEVNVLGGDQSSTTHREPHSRNARGNDNDFSDPRENDFAPSETVSRSPKQGDAGERWNKRRGGSRQSTARSRNRGGMSRGGMSRGGMSRGGMYRGVRFNGTGARGNVGTSRGAGRSRGSSTITIPANNPRNGSRGFQSRGRGGPRFNEQGLEVRCPPGLGREEDWDENSRRGPSEGRRLGGRHTGGPNPLNPRSFRG